MTLARRTAPLRGRRPVLVALAIIAAVAAGNVIVSSQRVAVTSLMIAAPLLCGLTVSAAETWAVGALATVVAASVFVWDQNLGSWRSWTPLAVTMLASGFAGVTAILRERLRRDEQRMRVLADLAGVANGGGRAEEIADAIARLLVPRLVDFCAIDLLRADGRVHRLAAATPAGLCCARNYVARRPGCARHGGDRAVGFDIVGRFTDSRGMRAEGPARGSGPAWRSVAWCGQARVA